MGMAASQARFLGLTARKSNVEYQGQQVNQERTALANDSANLYNEMMSLTVPTPPSPDNYYKTHYVLNDSQSGYDTTDYQFDSATKTYDGDDRYSVTLTTTREELRTDSIAYRLSNVSLGTDAKNRPQYSIAMRGTGTNKTTNVTYTIGADSPYKTENEDGSNKNVLDIQKNTIYKADKNIDGFTDCYGNNPQGVYYFYKDDNNVNHFMTQEQLFGYDDAEGNHIAGILEYDSEAEENVTNYRFSSVSTYKKPYSVTVKGLMEVSDTGRYSSIVIDEDESYPMALSGRAFTISVVQEEDALGYQEAQNDYEYEYAIYQKRLKEINAKTELIQGQDKQLELRLRELETEQNAIATEMDSVKKVIEDNVEKTFNIFG